jgi:hypothetical protein
MSLIEYEGRVCVSDELCGILKDPHLVKKVSHIINNDPYVVKSNGAGGHVLYVNGGLDSKEGYEILATPYNDSVSVKVIRKLEN